MIHVKEHKQPQHELASESYLTPKKLYLPLAQHIGKPSTSCVEKGQAVEEGQIIAKADAFISANLHAPVSGKILSIDICNHPTLKRSECIVLQPDGKSKEYTHSELSKTLSKEELLSILSASGIVGLGGAAFPTHVKLAPPKSIDTVIINGCECEPYLAADNRMMIEYAEEIVKGAEIICRIIGPKNLIFAVESNKPQAVEKIKKILAVYAQKLPFYKVMVFKSSYPQGGEKQLIYNTTSRKVPSGKLPLEVGCIVHNVATCFAIYEAVCLGKPLMQRLVGFYGPALLKPKNIWIKIGTSLQELFDEKILELRSQPKQIIAGGPMMGISITGLDCPITKGCGGFLFLDANTDNGGETACIRCARCVDACPMNLLPLEYAKHVKKDSFKTLNELNIKDCIECGCCAWSCPAKIPLVHYIKIGKQYAS